MILGKSENPTKMKEVISVVFPPLIIGLVLLKSEKRQGNALLTQVKWQHYNSHMWHIFPPLNTGKMQMCHCPERKTPSFSSRILSNAF